jgi:hypothetical protein
MITEVGVLILTFVNTTETAEIQAENMVNMEIITERLLTARISVTNRLLQAT